MKEEIVQLGEKGALVGILSTPLETKKSLPAFIFVNSGLVHRVGPFRIYVSISRELAKAGFNAMRIDLSGKGDSPARRNSKSLKENVIQDVSDAMDYLQSSKGINTFVVGGICTGADNTYDVGFNDSRVIGMIPVDGYAYPTLKFYAKCYLPKMLNLTSWMNLFKKVSSGILKSAEAKIDGLGKPDYQMIFPPIQTYKTNMGAALDLNKNFLIIYTGGWSNFYLYKEQFADAFPDLVKSKNVQVAYATASDHTFILGKDTRWLVDQITSWAKSLYLK